MFPQHGPDSRTGRASTAGDVDPPSGSSHTAGEGGGDSHCGKLLTALIKLSVHCHQRRPALSLYPANVNVHHRETCAWIFTQLCSW